MKVFFIILIAIAAGLGWYLYQAQFAGQSISPNGNGLVSATPAQSPVITPSPAKTTVLVTYTDAGFSQKAITVKKGTIVTFVNNSSDRLWVGSDPHPIHDQYPTTGGCIASTFDACSGIAPGASWSFQFDIAGTWGYHNHLNPGKKGTVVVQ